MFKSIIYRGYFKTGEKSNWGGNVMYDCEIESWRIKKQKDWESDPVSRPSCKFEILSIKDYHLTYEIQVMLLVKIRLL